MRQFLYINIGVVCWSLDQTERQQSLLEIVSFYWIFHFNFIFEFRGKKWERANGQSVTTTNTLMMVLAQRAWWNLCCSEAENFHFMRSKKRIPTFVLYVLSYQCCSVQRMFQYYSTNGQCCCANLLRSTIHYCPLFIGYDNWISRSTHALRIDYNSFLFLFSIFGRKFSNVGPSRILVNQIFNAILIVAPKNVRKFSLKLRLWQIIHSATPSTFWLWGLCQIKMKIQNNWIKKAKKEWPLSMLIIIKFSIAFY